MGLKEKIIKEEIESTRMEPDLHIIQKLVQNLNSSLLKLKVDRNQYLNEVLACRGLCQEIKEIMHATTQQISPKSD